MNFLLDVSLDQRRSVEYVFSAKQMLFELWRQYEPVTNSGNVVVVGMCSLTYPAKLPKEGRIEDLQIRPKLFNQSLGTAFRRAKWFVLSG